MLKSLTKREKTIFYIFVFIISVSLIFNFVIEPVFKNWSTLDNKIKAAEIKLIKGKELVSGEDYSPQSYDRYLEAVEPKGTDEEEMAQLLAAIEEIAAGATFKITEIKPLPVQSVDFYKRFLVEVSAESQMSQLTKFLYQLQKSPRVLKVTRLSLTSDSRQQGTLKVSLAISRITMK